MGWQRTQTLYRSIHATGQLHSHISMAHSSELNRNRIDRFLAANYQIGLDWLKVNCLFSGRMQSVAYSHRRVVL